MADRAGQSISGESDNITKASFKMGDHVPKQRLLDVTALIRSIQRAEGNPDCFKRAVGDCPELVCEWRTYCLEGG